MTVWAIVIHIHVINKWDLWRSNRAGQPVSVTSRCRLHPITQSIDLCPVQRNTCHLFFAGFPSTGIGPLAKSLVRSLNLWFPYKNRCRADRADGLDSQKIIRVFSLKIFIQNKRSMFREFQNRKTLHKCVYMCIIFSLSV